MQHLSPKETEINQVATNNNGEPAPFSLTSDFMGHGVASATYSFWDQSADELTAKGQGGMRQLHGFSPLDESYAIHTPVEDFVPDKVGKTGKTLEEYKAERDSMVPMIKRV